MDPWFSEQMAGVVGGAIGTFLGVVYGGGVGGIGGMLAGAGRARRLVLGMCISGIVVGLGLTLTGVVALILGQPWHVALAFGPGGLLIAVILGVMYPFMRAFYAQAEQRKLDAAAIRGA